MTGTSGEYRASRCSTRDEPKEPVKPVRKTAAICPFSCPTKDEIKDAFYEPCEGGVGLVSVFPLYRKCTMRE
jgi:hypothetical protein